MNSTGYFKLTRFSLNNESEMDAKLKIYAVDRSEDEIMLDTGRWDQPLLMQQSGLSFVDRISN